MIGASIIIDATGTSIMADVTGASIIADAVITSIIVDAISASIIINTVGASSLVDGAEAAFFSKDTECWGRWRGKCKEYSGDERESGCFSHGEKI